jgi:hypothetical protein
METRIPWPPVTAELKASVENDDVAVGSGLTAPAVIDPSGRKPPEALGAPSVGSGRIGGTSDVGGAWARRWALPAWARGSRTASANMAAMLPGRTLNVGGAMTALADRIRSSRMSIETGAYRRSGRGPVGFLGMVLAHSSNKVA